MEWLAEWNHAGGMRVGIHGPLRHALTLRFHDLDSLRQDVTYALRGILRSPGFSAAVVLTLAVGIGANSSVFSLINTVLLRPLPIPNADRLYLVFEEDSAGVRQLASYPTFLDWHDQAEVFESLAFVRGTALSLRVGDETSFVLASFVTDEFFDAFEIRPMLGRVLDAGDFAEGAPPSVVVSHNVWTNALGADTNALGQTVRVDELVAAVVGVLPPSFALPQWAPAAGNGIWMALQTLPAADRAALMQRDFHADSRVIGLLEEGVGVDAARAATNGVAQRLAISYPATSRRWTHVGLVPQRDLLVGNVGPRLYVIGAAVVAVLLICCVNLANLFMSRGATRTLEFAIRSAIGAGRGRVFRQLLTESLVLSAIGGIIGTSLALVSVHVLRVRLPAALPRLNEVSVDWRVLSFSLVLTMATASVFALVSARQVSWSNLARPLRQSGSSQSRVRGNGVRSWLIASQVALSTVLLIGAALLLKSLVRLSAVNPGFEPRGLTAVQVTTRLPQYQEPAAATNLYHRIAESVRAVPGIRDVGLINHAPFGGGSITSRASLLGDPRSASDETIVFFRTVSAGYFDTMGIPVVAGREFSAEDLAGPEGPLIVNETMARLWGETLPVGQRLNVLKAARDRPDFGEPIFGTVVGVVGDIRHFGPEVQPRPVVYVPFAHNVWSHIFVIARTNANAGVILNAIESAVREVESGIPLEGLGLGAHTLVDRLADRLAPRRHDATVVASFALVALVLALIGVYGVTSYTVVSEAREIGIRLALGARPRGVSRLMVARTIRLVVAGLAVGLVAGLLLTRFMGSVLFDVPPNDPETFLIVAAALLTVASLAGYLPARRAASIDPVSTLKG